MAAPKEYQDQMQYVRSISLEFTKMKLESTYALQWIGYYFIKYMQGPITNIKNTLASINDIIVKTMPSWTKVIAQVMSWFAQMGIDIVRVFTDIGRGLSEVSQLIPNKVKMIGGAIAGIAMIIRSGPMGALIAIFSAAILALDDFYAYLDGGESKLAPLWKKLLEFYKSLKDSGAIDAFKKHISDGFKAVEKVIGNVVNFIRFHLKDIEGFFKSVGQVIIGILKWLIDTIVTMFKNIGKVIQSNKELWKNLIQIIKDFTKVDFNGKNPIKDVLTWLMTKGVPGVINIFLRLMTIVSRVILFFDKFKFIPAVILGVTAALGYMKLAHLALNAAQKAGLIINTLKGAWSIATGIIDVMTKGVGFAAVAQDLWNAAMAANPIGAIALVIGVLITALVALALNWDKVKSAAEAALNWVVNKIKDVIGWIEKIPGISSIIKFMSGGGPNIPTSTSSYVYNQGGSSSNKTTISSTYNIYGSNGTAVANKINSNNNNLARSMGGNIR